MHEYLTPALQILREAGARAHREIARAAIREFKADDDVVTDGDLAVETHVLDALLRRFPGHGYESEEKGEFNADAEFVWILDPIDGSKYYARGVPLYSISLALQRNKQPVLGAVYIPSTDQMFHAVAGAGATLQEHDGERKLRRASPERLADCTVCLEIPSRNAPAAERRQAMQKMEWLVDHTQRVRILGVGSIGLCFCAMGGFDLYVNLGSRWKYCDYAAGKMILEEAGGAFLRAPAGVVAGAPERAAELINASGFADRETR